MAAPLENGTAMSGAEVAQNLRHSTPVDYSQVAVAQSAPLPLLSGAEAAQRPCPLRLSPRPLGDNTGKCKRGN